jgi:acid phosphatase (class A)
MRRMRPAVVLITLLAVFSFGADKLRFIQPQDVDWQSILSAPPADNSPEHQEETAILLHWQHKRTEEDVARCREEANADAFVFARVLGDWFNPRMLPVTADLFNQATVDCKIINNQAKANWNRQRPYDVNDEINPCVPLENTPSYPSGHAVRGIVWATILSEMFRRSHRQRPA